MAELLIVVIALLLSVVAGLWLYAQFSSAGGVAVSAFGLLRNGSMFLIGVFMLISGMWPLIIAGSLFIVLAVFLGSTHASDLNDRTSLRKRIAG